jgi:hypothetical protein
MLSEGSNFFIAIDSSIFSMQEVQGCEYCGMEGVCSCIVDIFSLRCQKFILQDCTRIVEDDLYEPGSRESFPSRQFFRGDGMEYKV